MFETEDVAGDFASDAVYEASKIPRFRGNPLIEALPLPPSEEEFEAMMNRPPDFHPDERMWPMMERMHQVDGLAHFRKNFQQQRKTFYALERILRNGYVGRVPRTAEYAKIGRRLYEMQRDGKSLVDIPIDGPPQISTALIGVSGTGKTTTLKRWAERYQRPIRHPKHGGAVQVPVIHIELVDSKSIKGVAMAIFAALERKLPLSNYVKLYTKHRAISDAAMLLDAAYLMHKHSVGLLICDEVQNLSISSKGSAALLAQLVALSNVLEAPLLFVGTNKAAKVLGLDFAMGRRSIGEGISFWDRLVPIEFGGNGEWEKFLEALWEYQWLKNHVPYSAEFSTIIYWGTQGIVDLTVKMFRSAQTAAMLDKTETLTVELFKSIHDLEFKIIHHMLDALRDDDEVALAALDDIRPLDFDRHLARQQAKLRAMKSPLYAVSQHDETFKARVLTSLTSIGYSYEDAVEAVTYVLEDTSAKGKERTLKQVRTEAEDYLEAPKKRRPGKNSRRTGNGAGMAPAANPKRFDEEPKDYRRAFAYAEAEGKRVLEMLELLGMAPMVEDFLEV